MIKKRSFGNPYRSRNSSFSNHDVNYFLLSDSSGPSTMTPVVVGHTNADYV
jgi:hypothetical protein